VLYLGKKLIYFSTVIIIISAIIIIYNKTGQAKTVEADKTFSAVKADTKVESTAQLIAEHKEVEEEKRAELLEDQKQKEQAQKNIETLKQLVEDIIGDNKDNIGVAYFDVSSSLGFNINGDKTFKAASTVKVPVVMATAELIKNNKLKLDDQVSYTSDDYEDGAGILQGSSKLDNPIKISELVDYSLIYSDNIAVNMLLRTIGSNYKYDFIEQTVSHSVNRSANETTPSDSLAILKRLYYNYDNDDNYNLIIKDLKNTIYHDRIDKYIPQSIVAHKIGDYENYINDIAIVYDDKPYILTVFTKDINDVGDEIIAKISKVIYDNR
jgi:beta-lactamase class A